MSIWRGLGWVLGVGLASMVPDAERKIERYRAGLVDLEAEPETDEEGYYLLNVAGFAGGSAGTARKKKPAPKAPAPKKPAGRTTAAVRAAKAPAKPRGRPPLNDGLTPAERKAAKAKREAMLERLARGRETRAKNLAAKKRAEKAGP